jgi:hypothetical protein
MPQDYQNEFQNSDPFFSRDPLEDFIKGKLSTIKTKERPSELNNKSFEYGLYLGRTKTLPEALRQGYDIGKTEGYTIAREELSTKADHSFQAGLSIGVAGAGLAATIITYILLKRKNKRPKAN